MNEGAAIRDIGFTPGERDGSEANADGSAKLIETEFLVNFVQIFCFVTLAANIYKFHSITVMEEDKLAEREETEKMGGEI